MRLSLPLVIVFACSNDKDGGGDTSDPSDGGATADGGAASDGGGGDTAEGDGGSDGGAASRCDGDAAREAAVDSFVLAASSFVATLDADLLASISFAMDDEERMTWDNRPVSTAPRAGVAFGSLSDDQSDLAYAMIAAGLSAAGNQRALDTILVDELAYLAGDDKMGERLYTLAVFGAPDPTQAWGLQLDGHHLVINWTVTPCEVILTPIFEGIQPIEVPTGDYAGLRVLGERSDAAFALMRAMDDDQLALAVVADAPPADIELGPGDDWAFPTDPIGIPVSELSADQQALFLDVVAAFLDSQPEPWLSESLVAAMAAPEDTYLAWMGPVDEAQLHYFRVSGPTLWLEYDLSPAPDHAHSIWRDPLDDYGADTLAAHYAKEDHGMMLQRPRLPLWQLVGVDALLARPHAARR